MVKQQENYLLKFVGSSRQNAKQPLKYLFNLGSQSKSVKIVVTADQNQIHGCCQEKRGRKAIT
jgi:hypothetical protein